MTLLVKSALENLRAGDKLPPQTFGPFGMPHLARYAEVSGDSNPIHLDEALAHKAGLAAPPVQGMLLMSAFEPALMAWRRISSCNGFRPNSCARFWRARASSSLGVLAALPGMVRAAPHCV